MGLGPKVARASQPWALVRNPVGIEGGGPREGERWISVFEGLRIHFNGGGGMGLIGRIGRMGRMGRSKRG